MNLFALALLGCTEVGLNTDIDRPEISIVLPVMNGTFDPEQPVQVCASIAGNRALESLDVILVSDVGGILATDGFGPCEGGDLGIEVMLPDAPQVLSMSASAGTGLESSDEVSITPIPNTPPRCEVLFPANDSTFIEGSTVDLQVRVDDDESTDLEISVESSVDGALLQQSVTAGSSPSFSLSLGLGSHDLVVLVEDSREATDICVVSVDVVACTDTDGDGFDTCHGDCDDADVHVYPGAPEVPDGQDNDCDGTTDEGTALYDDDGDGLNELDGDCDDSDASIAPGETEVPDDGIDQDCSGTDTITCFEDLDGDGHGGSTTALDPAGVCGTGLALTSTDCDDADASRNPDAAEVPADGIDQDCDGNDPAGCFDDGDGDGFGSATVLPPGDGDCDDPGESSFGTDCNDSDTSIYPGADEVLDDGIDQDCSNADRVTCYTDGDGDGFAGTIVVDEEGTCVVGHPDSTDCDDVDPSISPNGIELADDGVDQDCDGVDAITCFVDSDFDGQGDVATTVALDGSCDLGDQESTNDTDCDDTDASIYLGAPEVVADGIDQDCDGQDSSDCFEDLDGDGWGSSHTVASIDADCDDPGEANQSGDCDDSDDSRNPGETDTAGDGIDQDCNGADTVECFEDADRDGFGSTTVVMAADGTCDTGDEESLRDDDCADGNPDRNPHQPEVADDGIDQDCSGTDTVTCYRDVDGDLFGGLPVLADDGVCNPGQDEASQGGDCADGNADRYPGNTEVPDDGIDQDCSGDDTVSCYTDVDGDDFGTGAAQLLEAVCGALASVDGDCDDNEAHAFPGNLEVADDGIDQDCSGTDTLTCYQDNDGDHFGSGTVLAADGSCDAGANEAPDGGDCADNNPDRYPGNTEIPDDGIDQDCSGDDTLSCYTDVDGDDYGVGVAQLLEASCGTLASVDGDCDDNEAAAFPGNTEVADDGIDQDCSGTDTITCYLDSDGDHFGASPLLAADGSCDVGADEVPDGGDCDDGNANRYPGNIEVLDDGIDQDCSGADSIICYLDHDDDQYGVGGVLPTEGSCGLQLASVLGDCDDNEATAFPGNGEIVDDGIDQDCSGSDSISCFEDDDQDAYGVNLSVVAADGSCDTVDRESDNALDCDDGNSGVNPGASEVPYNGTDEDCLDGDLTDVDGDGVDGPTTDCDDMDPDTFPGNPETFDGADNNCDGRCDEGFIGAGDLVISEIMINVGVGVVSEQNGEWFELYNDSPNPITVCGGWTFSDDDSDSYTTPNSQAPVTIPVGGYMVAATQGDTAVNGGVPADLVYDWTFLKKGNTGDELTITFDGVEIDDFAWGTSFDADGFSQELSMNHLDVLLNDNTANWCDSVGAWPGSDGDFGTPGEANDCAL